MQTSFTMRRSFSVTLIALWAGLVGTRTIVADQPDNTSERKTAQASDVSVEEPYVPKSDAELRRMLSRMQYNVTQREDTEPAFRNLYWDNKRDGIYRCVVCGLPLFSSDAKYKSGTGWPSFYQPLAKENVGYRTDWRLFYARTEVHCKRCKAHLGHIFDDGPPPTGKRFCMNSASLRFVEAGDSSETPEAKRK
jgi:methionine-R-sulfoxide reductase